MDTSYCLKCKKQTKNLNSKGFVTKNKKYLVKSLCNICKSRKSKFIVNNKPKGSYQIYSVRYRS